MEGSSGDFKSPAHGLHHLPQPPPWFSGSLWHRDRHPRAKLFQQLAALREEVLCVIFLDLHKAYDALDRSRCLTILEGYGVGPRARRILQSYWRRLTMVARVGGYYGAEFQGARRVTQGDPLSPTIFNVVVDVVVRHWVTGVITEMEERGERGKEGRH